MREFKIGDKVFNKAYGEGTVVATDSKQEDEQHPILVDHKESGVKTTYTVEGYYYDKDSLDSSCDIKHINNTTEKDMKCTTQAEVFEQFARVSKLIEGTDLTLLDVFRFGGEKPHFEYANRDKMLSNPEEYSFALALVEGKPVFVGDKLWSNYYQKEVTVASTHTETDIWSLVWDKPKKTFMLNGIALPLPTDDNSNVHVEVSYNYDNGGTKTFYPVPREILKYRWASMEDRDKVMKAITDLLDGVTSE